MGTTACIIEDNAVVFFFKALHDSVDGLIVAEGENFRFLCVSIACFSLLVVLLDTHICLFKPVIRIYSIVGSCLHLYICR